VVGWDIVESYGGRVCLTDAIDGASTSGIVATMLQKSKR